MAEWSANAQQTVNPGETVIFTENPVPGRLGLVRHRDGTGIFLLKGLSGCPCNPSTNYLVQFGANIAIPTGGTVGPISLALAIDGNTVPATQMTITPAAVEEFGNVAVSANVSVWCGCCENFSVRNISDQPILVQNANLIISR